MTMIQENGLKIAKEAHLAPVVESRVFESNPQASFWIGVTAIGDEVLLSAERTAAGIQRANMYIDQCSFLPETARQEDGTESDEDDSRSTHFVVIENQMAAEGLHRVVATSRLIEKKMQDDSLPVERLFPEAFDGRPAPLGSGEASRFMAFHEDKFTQSVLSLSLIRAMATRSARQGVQPVYAVVEDYLTKLFDKISLPYERLSDFKKLSDYGNTKNMAIMFEPNRILREASAGRIGKEILQAAFNPAAVKAEGMGHFDGSLMSPMTEHQVA